jgi:hypothetical protein
MSDTAPQAPKGLPYRIPNTGGSPRWATPDNRIIEIDVIFEHIGTIAVRYACAAIDPSAPHSEEIFARASAGEFGDIATYQPPAPVVPAQISMAQFRKALLASGLLDDVESLMSRPDTSRSLGIDWEYATEVRRSAPQWADLFARIDKTTTDLDAVFLLAKTL